MRPLFCRHVVIILLEKKLNFERVALREQRPLLPPHVRHARARVILIVYYNICCISILPVRFYIVQNVFNFNQIIFTKLYLCRGGVWSAGDRLYILYTYTSVIMCIKYIMYSFRDSFSRVAVLDLKRLYMKLVPRCDL